LTPDFLLSLFVIRKKVLFLQKNMVERFLEYIPLLTDKLKTAKNVLLLPHANPDGDTIGSVLAFAHLLKKMGKTIAVYTTPQVPEFLKWLPDARQIVEINNNNAQTIIEDSFSNYDLIIGLDWSANNRLRLLSKAFTNAKCYKILIDHHPNPDPIADLILCEPNYSSTTEFVFDLISNSELFPLVDTTFASCIYCGMMTDTGSFSYNSTNPNSYKILSELLKFGIEKDKIYSNVYENFTINRMRFMGHVMLNRMVVNTELKTAYIYITSEDRKRFKEQFGDTENFVNIPLQIRGIYFSAIFIERDNFIKISFRSKGTFPVNDFSCKHYNGGGHTNASGGESFKSLKDTIEEFETLINTEYKEVLKKYKY
jgi:phosphoesterase RecJ-like protein